MRTQNDTKRIQRHARRRRDETAISRELNAAFALGVAQGESNQRKKNLEIILEGRKKVPLNPSDIGRPFFKEDHPELDRPSIKANSTAIRPKKTT